MYQNSNSIGNIGESIAIAELSKRNIPVSIPFGQNVPYDLIIDIEGTLYKIQCKTTEKIKDDKMIFSICRNNGFTYEHKKYEENEVDYIFLYCIENNYIGIIDIKELNTTNSKLILRLKETKNNQKIGVRFCNDFSLDIQLKKLKKNNETLEK